ncbi:hypothetical protein KCG48_13890 [Proteiniclasticum sp. BAD-10]|uniref:Uncharacterized protein n=1 Tax=Proteiniclasticum sediminis TaxID=2804028 RepID=A0A941CU18_9CLOT|nr:hypothetical protein [Proteiniclasticum sediminis]MBR0577401.1 hypothetical protein [Proteiniclasticum sediminis]
MKQEIMDAINQELEAALNDVTDMEAILEQSPSQDELKEKFKRLAEKVSSLESLLIQEGIL